MDEPSGVDQVIPKIEVNQLRKYLVCAGKSCQFDIDTVEKLAYHMLPCLHPICKQCFFKEEQRRKCSFCISRQSRSKFERCYYLDKAFELYKQVRCPKKVTDVLPPSTKVPRMEAGCSTEVDGNVSANSPTQETTSTLLLSDFTGLKLIVGKCSVCLDTGDGDDASEEANVFCSHQKCRSIIYCVEHFNNHLQTNIHSWSVRATEESLINDGEQMRTMIYWYNKALSAMKKMREAEIQESEQKYDAACTMINMSTCSTEIQGSAIVDENSGSCTVKSMSDAEVHGAVSVEQNNEATCSTTSDYVTLILEEEKYENDCSELGSLIQDMLQGRVSVEASLGFLKYMKKSFPDKHVETPRAPEGLCNPYASEGGGPRRVARGDETVEWDVTEDKVMDAGKHAKHEESMSVDAKRTTNVAQGTSKHADNKTVAADRKKDKGTDKRSEVMSAGGAATTHQMMASDNKTVGLTNATARQKQSKNYNENNPKEKTKLERKDCLTRATFHLQVMYFMYRNFKEVICVLAWGSIESKATIELNRFIPKQA